jgi:hypothetical protein
MNNSDRMMPSITYSVEQIKAHRMEGTYHETPTLPVSAWQEFAHTIAHEKSLTPFSAEVLAERWQRGYSAVVVEKGRILAHASCLPIYFDASRARLAVQAGVKPIALPQVDVYETLTGWTDPSLRGQRIGFQLQHHLMQRFIGPNCLAVGVTVGLGAGLILARLGWQVLGWQRAAYLSGLLADADANCCDGQIRGWHPQGVIPYDGDPVSPLPDGDHPWQAFCHLWVSDMQMASTLDRRFGALVADLCRWQAIWQKVIREVLLAEGWLPIVLDE